MLREPWVKVAKTLAQRGDEVYVFDPNPILRRLLRQEGLGDAVVAFDRQRSERLPLSRDRDANVVDYLLRATGREYEAVRTEYANFSHQFDRLGVDVCVFWNDYRSAGVPAAGACDVDCLYMENGYVPGTIQLDAAGVNRNASVASLSEQELLDRGRPYELPTELAVAGVEPLSRTDVALGFGSKAVRDTAAAARSIRHRLPNRGELLPARERQPTLPDQFVFVPFQVHDDTQILYNAPFVDDMRSFLTVARQAVDAVTPELPVVVKEHPVDRDRVDYSDLRDQFDDVRWFTDYPIEELTTAADAVVTVNSSVGFQSLSKGTPVVTVGETLYDSAPNVRSAGSLGGVSDALAAALNGSVNQDRVDEYVAAVRERLFAPGTPDAFTDETVRHVVGYIDALTATAAQPERADR